MQRRPYSLSAFCLRQFSLTLVLQWYFLKCTCILQSGGGVNDPPGVIRVLCVIEIKFQRLYPFSRVSFSTVPMLNFSGDFFTPKFKMAPENRK